MGTYRSMEDKPDEVARILVDFFQQADKST
jgi:hypothetical protein